LKILNVVGARPNFMKIAPIQREMKKYPKLQPLLIHTGQHYDEKMSRLFFDDLELPQPDVYLGVGSGTHAQQTARIMVEFEKVIEQEKPDLVLVVGDVNSTMACSIVASKMGVKIGHVEAGLRSFDRTMPEEINRLVTDALADFLFVTEKSGSENLQREGIAAEKIYFTGNVMIDSLVYFMQKAQQSDILKRMNLNGYPYALITLHRPNNVDIKENFEKLLDAFAVIQKELKIVFPIHPRSLKMVHSFGLGGRIESMKNLLMIDPVGYLDFMQLMRQAKLVLTDSGGIQEETTYLGVPCLTMRDNTERPVTVNVGTNIIVGSDTQCIIKESTKIIHHETKSGKIPDLWDGHAAERIVKIVADSIP
jgi:UDP-N-acetylglucosamine 2-epimerase (non-hydrolysing)